MRRVQSVKRAIPRRAEQCILIVHFDDGNGGISGIRFAGVGVFVREDLAGILFLEFDAARQKVGDDLAEFGQLVRVFDAVCFPIGARYVQVDIGIDAVLFELRDEIIEAVKAIRAEFERIGFAVVENIGL